MSLLTENRTRSSLKIDGRTYTVEYVRRSGGTLCAPSWACWVSAGLGSGLTSPELTSLGDPWPVRTPPRDELAAAIRRLVRPARAGRLRPARA